MNNRIKLNQRGLSLVELMIAMVIGLMLTAAVLQVFVSSRVSYSMQTGLAQLQENGRFALEFLSRDIRQLGFQGCSVENSLANVVNDGSGVDPFINLSRPLDGQDNIGNAVAFNGRNAISGSDVMHIKYAEASGACRIESHSSSNSRLSCEGPHSFSQGDVLIASDCGHSAIFQKSNLDVAGANKLIFHASDKGKPGNCVPGLGGPVTCSGSGKGYSFTPGSLVQRLLSFRYFIALNNFGRPALYRQGIIITGAKFGTGNQELVEGVEDMQILYGVDTDADGRPDKYVDGAVAGADFNAVGAVRISLLLRSTAANLVKEGQTLNFNGVNRQFNDGYLRKVFSTTIQIRNRL
ncbi:PilW family protein [Amphritea balenae]|uniref:Prepilin-type N-terminal cleavage/methylation domain-containing protein n=1 Tax=Amphritea balenae TaxID=452629 RepID=A0A3P1SNQ4_9GAMM|nr:PilW family protein [Amphritea balenae]RRC98786.1 prepilin-type N-terminal cleavage/methylation domain-containing protein [Amphritea balenae]GGK61661.1 pilus assembly protein PilW [Amphritea balenae]